MKVDGRYRAREDAHVRPTNVDMHLSRETKKEERDEAGGCARSAVFCGEVGILYSILVFLLRILGEEREGVVWMDWLLYAGHCTMV